MRIKENDFFKQLENDGFKLISMVGKSYKGKNDYTFSAKDIIIERGGYKVHAQITSRKGIILGYRVLNVNF